MIKGMGSRAGRNASSIRVAPSIIAKGAGVVRIVVQKLKSREFLKADGGWTSDAKEASTFPTGSSAVEFCVKSGIAQAEILYLFGDARDDFRLAIPEMVATFSTCASMDPAREHK